MGAVIVCNAYRTLGHECWITSAAEGTHKKGSLHYLGLALDFRTRDMTKAEKTALVGLVIEALTEEFDVVLEKTHLHIEYHPKLPLR